MGQLGAPMPMPRINVGGGGPGGPQMRGAMPTMEATEVHNVDRGGLTGDRMLTFDISGSLLSAVEWDEREAKLNDTTVHGKVDGEKINEVIASKINKATEQMETSSLKKSERKKLTSRLNGYKNVALVVPLSAGHSEQYKTVDMIDKNGKYPVRVKNIFNRAIAAVAGAAYRLDSSSDPMPKASNATKDKDEDKIMYVRVEESRVKEVAMVLGEGKKLSKEVNCRSGYTRFATTKVLCAPSDGEVEISAEDRGHFRGVNLVVVDREAGNKATDNAVNALMERLGLGEGVKRLILHGEDAVKGGCLLSAAELTSCRNYARLESGAWKLMYLLPFGDGYLSSAITMKVEYVDGTPTTEQVLFSRCRLPKKELGPSNAALAVRPHTKEFEYGFAYKSVCCGEDGKVWPKVSFWEEGNDEAIATVYPLDAADSSAPSPSAVKRATLVVSADPGVSTVRAKVDQGKSIKDIQGTHKMIFASVLLFLMILGAWWLYYNGAAYFDAEARKHDQAWLEKTCTEVGAYREDDYEEHPLCDSVERTIREFSKGDKMWLLHRQLKRRYPNSSISRPPSMGSEL